MPLYNPAASSGIPDPMTQYTLIEHFTGANAAGETGGLATTNSGAVTTSTAAEAGHPGILSLGTSTSATSGPTWTRGSLLQYLLGSGSVSVDVVFKLSNLSNDNATDTFQIYFGLGDVTSGAEPNNGIYLTYTNALNSGNFVFRSASGGSRTSLNTNVTPVALTWYRMSMVVASAAGVINCYLSTSMTNVGASLGTISATIPTATGFGTQLTMKKLAGTTSRVAYVDMVRVVKQFS